MVILADEENDFLKPELLPENIRTAETASAIQEKQDITNEQKPIEKKKADYEKEMIIEALEKNRWNQSVTADELGIHESTLRYRMRKFGIRKPTFKSDNGLS
jgi:DNA-binding NtrC family response regulator